MGACSDPGSATASTATTSSTSSGSSGGTGASATGATTGTGGSTGGGGSGTAGSAGAPITDAGGTGGGTPDSGQIGFSRPQGKLPNKSNPASMLNLPEADWQKGLVSPSLEVNHHINQPIAMNGYLQLSGNAEFTWYDIEDPTKPKRLSQIVSPGFNPIAGGKAEGEAESHQVSIAKYGDRFYEVTTAGTGVDIWNMTDQTRPLHVKGIKLEGINYGDFTAAVWGMAWQGDTIYVGGTDTGLHILDARDPNNVTFVKRIPTSAFGGVSAGPVYAIGNILVITTPKENGGIATMDISDPLNPVVLDSILPVKSYIGAFYRHYVYLLSPLRVWDVLTDPTNIGTATTPISALTTESSEYMSFADGYMFLGHLRPHPGASKIDVTDPKNMVIKSRIWGRHVGVDGGTVIYDDQFTIAIGSLLVMADDEKPYLGAVIGAQSADPDTKPPLVDTVIPRDKATGQSVKSRIGISFTDNIELATVNPASVIVRPLGGQPLAGKWGLYMGVLNFDPDADLAPRTTYEVILPQGGLTDLVGNALAQPFKSTFTTQ